MAKTIEQLKAQSAEVMNASIIGENTATRVGNLFNDIVEHIEQETEERNSQDVTIATQLSNEIERAKNMELGISTKLNDEIERAQEAERNLENRTSDIVKRNIDTGTESIHVEDSNGNKVFYLDENGLDAKNVKSNGKDVLTEHQDISGLATKEEVEKKQDKFQEESIYDDSREEIIIATNSGRVITSISSKIEKYSIDEEQSWVSDDFNGEGEGEEYAKINQSGFFAKDYFYIDGTPIKSESVWKNKTIAYFGTSLPAQGYPQIIGTILEANVYNQAIGSSMMRCGVPNNDYKAKNVFGDDLGLNKQYFSNIMRSMSRTQEELKYIFDNWTDDRRKANLMAKGYTESQVANVKGYSYYIGGTFPEEGTDPSQSADWPTSKPIDVYAGDGETYKAFRKLAYSCCWDTSVNIEADLSYAGKITEKIEGRLQKFIDGTINTDLFVFDHFRNDSVDIDAETYLSIPSDEDDRNYAIGAFNYLVKQIMLRKPTARIIIVGHVDNDDTKVQLAHVWEAQEKAANYWGIPICKLWELLNIRCFRWITTTGYWGTDKAWHENGYNGSNHVWASNNGLNAADYENPRQLSDGTWVHNLTTRMVWFRDDIHPVTYDAKKYMAETIASFINNLKL